MGYQPGSLRWIIRHCLLEVHTALGNANELSMLNGHGDHQNSNGARYVLYNEKALEWLEAKVITLHHITPRCNTLHYNTSHHVAIHNTLHYNKIHSIALHYITLHCITLYYIIPHCITRRSTRRSATRFSLTRTTRSRIRAPCRTPRSTRASGRVHWRRQR